ncbi:hypothetical protein PRZ48_000787 [Zasmidium cellare]|uniref:Required for respiratory growth protein 9, mitochondrial n=1 Tax=Zasmidium cellare TaxID=395010 RepID=A0ABR0F1U2_ZASCE|nr:hypothetical protein PRZ48_000787 [Zasmidium cellare]
MHRCNCSTRALESFVRDFAGISLRQQRAQLFFQQYRSLSTRPTLRQSQTATSSHPDDGHITFDFEAVRQKREDLRIVGTGRDVREEREQVESSGGIPHGEEEWHADVEITGQDTQAGGHEDKSIDSISLRTLHTTGPHHEVSSSLAVPLLHLPALSQHIPTTDVTGLNLSTNSREADLDKRKLRKLRRMEQGQFRLDARKRWEREVRERRDARKRGGAREVAAEEGREDIVEELREEDDVVDVLGKIDALEGPAVEKRVKREKESKKDGDDVKPKPAKREAKDDTTKTRKTRDTNTTSSKPNEKKPPKEPWQIQKSALKQKFGDQGWSPNKRLSPDTLEGIRALHASDPATYSTAMLASHFQITPEAIRRILKSKWQPSAKEAESRMERWERRGAKKWEEMAGLGMKPPKKWRAMGVGAEEAEKALERKEMMREGLKRDKGRESWESAVEMADRLPMEGSFADRIM